MAKKQIYINSKHCSKNIHYKTEGIINYFDGYRDKWEDFYPSEHWAFNKLAGPSRNLGRILDVGCALGGLGLALAQKFKVEEYFGVDINPQAIEKAKNRIALYSIPVRFECGDITEMAWLRKKTFDVVVSLSCADWNINTNGIINTCWQSVERGGSFVISVRLTPDMGINDITKSYQPISYDNYGNIVESANYVIFNYQEFFNLIKSLTPAPSQVSTYGYWGKPSSSAVTPYKKLVFANFIIKKKTGDETDKEIKTELFLPLSLFIQDK